MQSAHFGIIIMAVESFDTKTSSKIKIKNWQWSLILFGFMLAYLVLGAFIFDFTETTNSIDAQNRLYKGVIDYYASRPCLKNDYTIMPIYGNKLIEYLSQGASLKPQHWKLDPEDSEPIGSTWTVSKASIFTLTIITTIGYGDIVPRTFAGKLFCVFYAMVGIPLMGFTLSIFGKSLEGFIKRYKKAMKLLMRPVRPKRTRNIVAVVLTVVLVASALVLVPAIFLSHYEEWSFFDAIYFFFITVSTIGFGDFVLESCSECGGSVWIFVLLFAFYVFCGICVITVLFSAFTTYQRRKFEEAESLLVTLLNNANSSIVTTTRRGAGEIEMAEYDNNSKEDNFASNGQLHAHETLAVDVHENQLAPYPFVQAIPQEDSVKGF